VVVKDVPDDATVIGIPARVVKIAGLKVGEGAGMGGAAAVDLENAAEEFEEEFK
jgi:serine acetyltransferase